MRMPVATESVADALVPGRTAAHAPGPDNIAAAMRHGDAGACAQGLRARAQVVHRPSATSAWPR